MHLQRKTDVLGEATYTELKGESIVVQWKEVRTASLSSYSKAVEIATIMKERTRKGEILLAEAVASLPGVESGISLRSLEKRPIE